jgi:hypothetical protein
MEAKATSQSKQPNPRAVVPVELGVVRGDEDAGVATR